MWKALKWLVALPVALFVTAFVLFAIFHTPKNETVQERAFRDCKSDAEAIRRTDPMRGVAAYQQCEILNR